jgi:hypothetical protein
MARKKSPPTAMARKKPMNPKKSKAIDKCIHHIVDDYADCINMTNPDGSYKYSDEECQQYWMAKFKECMASYGFPLAREYHPRPSPPPSVKPPVKSPRRPRV